MNDEQRGPGNGLFIWFGVGAFILWFGAKAQLAGNETIGTIGTIGFLFCLIAGIISAIIDRHRK